MSVIETPPRSRRRRDSASTSGNTKAVEAEDVSPATTPHSFLMHLLQRMSPSQCLSAGANFVDVAQTATSTPCCFSDEVNVEKIATSLLRDLKREGKLRSVALLKLYRLTDRERKENRIPVVCTTQFDAIGAIVPCLNTAALSPSATAASDRRQALLLLNNLCVPVENKAAILLGEPIRVLLPALLDILRQSTPESYLAAVCLFNLSFLDDAKSLLCLYVPPEEQLTEGKPVYRKLAPTDDPRSLLRTIETTIKVFVPFVFLTLSSKTRTTPTNSIAAAVAVSKSSSHPEHSVEGECVRWLVGVIRNLCTLQENAVIVATETVIPTLSIQCLHASLTFNKDLSWWKRDTLEDASLMLWVHLAQHDECLEALRDIKFLVHKNSNRNDEMTASSTLSALSVLHNFKGLGGIHETRASALWRRLHPGNDMKNKFVSSDHDEKKE